MTRITAHAVERYQQRVAPVTKREVIAALDTPGIRKAVAFGARYVRLGTGHRIVINDGVVVTVLPFEARHRLHTLRNKP